MAVERPLPKAEPETVAGAAPETEAAKKAGSSIALAGITKRFDSRNVLDQLDLKISAGESVVVLGKSGTGKSVLLKHIIGLLRPDSGTVEIDGQDLWTLSDRERDVLRQKFGMSFQEGALFDSMSVGENISFPLRRHTKKSKKEIQERVDECLEMVRLSGVADKRPSELSGGMRRRVGFARAIALSPQVLLFDEPTTGLDPITTDVIVKVITELKKRLHPTMVTITHDLKAAFEIADRVALLDQGKIVVDLTPKEFEVSDDPRVVAFVKGDSSLDESMQEKTP
jgi:phospholipid/cholesterol/gamma-HCH transport system ATP-binding protein